MAEAIRRSTCNPAASGRYLLCPDVVLMPLEEGTAQLLDLDGSAFGLSETATRMLQAILDGGAQRAVRRIAEEHAVHLDKVRADLSALLATLRAKRLIRHSDDHLARVRLRTAIAITISYPALNILRLVRNQRLKALALLAVARLCFALAGWARTVDAWRKCVKPSHTSTANSEPEGIIDAIDSAIRRSANDLPSIGCKERALCCWFMLHSVGVPASLVMGVRSFPFSGHCWCEVDERIVTDSPENCKAYTPIICYDA
jgi:transglutaminase superfamily protein/coenzyme PQQ synthesis protein D (PqqD)